MKERPYVQMRPLVEALTGALAPYLTSPFAFFGHSMGALTCFEVARQVRRQDLPEPVHLFVSAYRAPQVPDLDPPLCHLPDALFVDELQRRYQGIPEAILREKELLDLFLPVLRADLTILETYRYQDEAPLDYPISAFGGDQDRRVSREELAAWREQTHSTFTLKTFPGDHFFLHSARRSLLSALIKDLTRYMGTQNGSKTNGR